MKTKAKATKNPWLYKAPDYYGIDDREIGPQSAEDRIAALKFFETAKLRAVIAWSGTQKTVRARALMFLKRRGIDVDKSGS